MWLNGKTVACLGSKLKFKYFKRKKKYFLKLRGWSDRPGRVLALQALKLSSVTDISGSMPGRFLEQSEV